MKEEDNEGGRREYMRDYQRKRRAGKKRVDLVYGLDEYLRLEREARAHGRKITPFIKACADAYLKKSYVVPDEERVHQLEVALRRIGSNVNQIAARAHRTGLSTSEINKALALVYELEDQVAEALRNPVEVES